MFDTVDEAVKAARTALPVFTNLPLDVRRRIIANIRTVMAENSAALAKKAVFTSGEWAMA